MLRLTSYVDNTVVLEFVQHSQAIPSGFNEPYKAPAAEPMHDTIIAFTLAVRIATVSRVYGNRLQPSEAYNTAHLWSRLYRRVENTLKKINYDIENRPYNAIRAILQNIHGIKSVEVGFPNENRHLLCTIANTPQADAAVSGLATSYGRFSGSTQVLRWPTVGSRPIWPG